MSNAIELESVGKAYRRGAQRIVALDRIDLQVPTGSILGFIGPNGAGKSTAIKILVGLVRSDRGQARILGQPCGTVAARKAIGYLPETAVYHEFMTVGELIRVHAVLAGLPSAVVASRCEAVLSRVRLEHRTSSPLRELSKGMQQRFGLAQALLGEPQVLILDEPTSGLDPLSQREVKDILVDLRSHGMTIFFSSHQLTDMEAYCDQVGILHQGRLLACSPMQDLLGADGRLRIAFSVSDDAIDSLRTHGLDVQTNDTSHFLLVERGHVYDVVACLKRLGADLIGMEPVRRRLEEAYFDLVAGVEKTT